MDDACGTAAVRGRKAASMCNDRSLARTSAPLSPIGNSGCALALPAAGAAGGVGGVRPGIALAESVAFARQGYFAYKSLSWPQGPVSQIE